MMAKKIIFVLIILVVLVLGWFLGVVFGGGKFLSLLSPENKTCLATPCPSASPQNITRFTLSPEYKKILSDKENFRAGLAEAYKAIPLYPGIEENEVWTFLKPVEGILYTAVASRSEVAAFYETKLKTDAWIKKSSEEAEETIKIQFSQGDKLLHLIVTDRPPIFLPQELGLKEQTYISLNFTPLVNP